MSRISDSLCCVGAPREFDQRAGVGRDDHAHFVASPARTAAPRSAWPPSRGSASTPAAAETSSWAISGRVVAASPLICPHGTPLGAAILLPIAGELQRLLVHQIGVVAVHAARPKSANPPGIRGTTPSVIGSRFGSPVVPEVIANISTFVPGANSAVTSPSKHAGRCTADDLRT